MKLQKRFSRKIGKVVYFKWIITIPPDNIEKLGWKEGQKLESDVNPEGLVVKKQKSSKTE